MARIAFTAASISASVVMDFELCDGGGLGCLLVQRVDNAE
jgi:hypothetical protein